MSTARKYVIGFNGPPKCGKDQSARYAADILQERGFDTKQMKFADVLKRTVAYFMHTKYTHKEIEKMKDQPVEYGTMGKTLRDAYIAFSEDFAKPIYGDDIFGRLTAKDIEVATVVSGKGVVFLISDCGFLGEQNPVIDLVGGQNYALLQIVRPGYTFENDSRSYIRPSRGMFGTVHNIHDLDHLRAELVFNIERIINAGGWYP